MKASTKISMKRVRVVAGFNSYYTHRISGWIGKERIRINVKDPEEAAGELKRLRVREANERSETEARNTTLSADQLREAEAVFHRLGDKSLSLAADFFLKNYQAPRTDKTLQQAYEDFLADKTGSIRRLSRLTIYSYRSDIPPFIDFVGPVLPHEVTVTHAINFLKSRRVEVKGPDGRVSLKPISVKRWNNLRGNLHTFFNWCKQEPRGWISSNPFAAVEKFRWRRDKIESLSAAECLRLLDFTSSYKGGVMMPYVALALFAGVRPSTKEGELAKLSVHPKLHDLVNLGQGIIHITKDIAKVRDLRQTKIRTVLHEWLTKFPLKKYKILPTNHDAMIQEIRKQCGLVGKDDILRHTFISMHVADSKSIAAAAYEAGTSETIIKKHYLNLTSDAEAALFWNMGPEMIRKGSKSRATVEAIIKKIEGRRFSGTRAVETKTVIPQDLLDSLGGLEEEGESARPVLEPRSKDLAGVLRQLLEAQSREGASETSDLIVDAAGMAKIKPPG